MNEPLPATERANPASRELDRLDTRAAVALFAREDRAALAAVERAGDAIARTVESVAEALRSGGRLIYVGAGTSGRLAMLDAVECPPTFGTEPERVQAVLAGGEHAWARAVEGAEDDREAGAHAMRERAIGARDCVIGIAASGRTPFVLAALDEAARLGARTVLIACVTEAERATPPAVDDSIRLECGPEVLTGSTRLKAGTATKLALNTISTLAMVRIGKVHENLMVDVRTRANAKLVDRGERLVMQIAAVERERARELLALADGEVKLAILIERRALDLAAARAHLERHAGFLRAALEARPR